MKKQLLLFLIGAVLGSFYDGFHTYSNTTYYPNPWILKMAWWVPLNFGLAILAVADSHVSLDRTLKRKGRGLSWAAVLSGLALFGVLYFTSGFLPRPSAEKAVILWLGAVFLWILFDRTWQGVLLGILTGVVGSLVEITMTSLGLFFYVRPDFHGIPCWLPALYFGASVTVGNLGRKLL
jgi:insulin-induced protein